MFPAAPPNGIWHLVYELVTQHVWWCHPVINSQNALARAVECIWWWNG